MYAFLTILIIIICVLLVLVVLIQNPKGGGLSQTFGGFSNQVLGVQRTTDLLEKITWGLATGLAVLCLVTIFFIPKTTSTAPASDLQKAAQSTAPVQLPANNNQPANTQPANSNITQLPPPPKPAK
jgi:preprotein translocase subunit SecG